MRIVSWNMGGQTFSESTHREAWRHLLDVLKPDVALLQEARPLPDCVDELGSSLILQPISNVSWGTAIVVPAGHVQPLDLGLTTVWMDYVRVVAAEVLGLPISPLRVVSVHPHFGRFDEALLEDRPGLEPKLECARSVWSCDVAYALAREFVAGGGPFIVAGDWNTARLFDRTSTNDPGSGEAFFERGTSDGWVDVHHQRYGREGRTWFRGTDHPYQLEHVFTDGLSAALVADVWIDERAAVDPRLSDHAPLIVDFKSQGT